MRQRYIPRPVGHLGEPFDNAELAWFWYMRCREMPVLAGLFMLIWRTRHDVFVGLDRQLRQTESALEYIREQFAAYKLEVATTYASIPALKEAERRLTEHLVRIELKLDGVTGRRGGART